MTSLNPTHRGALAAVVDACSDIYSLGWAENHAGNLTYRLTSDQLGEFELSDRPSVALAVPYPTLGGQFYLVTAAGSPFRLTTREPEIHLGIVEISPDGAQYTVRWGFSTGKRPTSEFPAHLRAHERRQQLGTEDRVVLHCHPTNLIAMTHAHSLDEAAFTRTLWAMNSEGILAIPDGVGVLPWMVCGTDEIGIESAEKFGASNFVVWAFHGVLVAAGNPDLAVGIVESVDKAAATWLLAGAQDESGITPSQLQDLATAFGFFPEPRLLGIGQERP
jgi:rhamnulose-1-phosphate aldolase